MTTSQATIDRFRRLHEPGPPLLLLNAWDAMSARALELAGAPAIGTTSGGIAWAHGFPDGEKSLRADMISAIRTIANAVSIPVTADIESGYGDGTPRDVAETVRMVVDTGVVGVNIEDSRPSASFALLETDDHCRRIEAARAAAESEGVDLFINARTDIFLMGVGAESERLSASIERAHSYVRAGADGIFVPGLVDLVTMRELAAALETPLNVMAVGASPRLADLAEAGVRRVSLGSGLTQLSVGVVDEWASKLLREGDFTGLRFGPDFHEVNRRFHPNDDSSAAGSSPGER